MKLRKEGGKWYVNDGNKVIEFDNSLDAWRYILLLKEIRPHHTYTPKPLYPVYTLDPRPQLRGKHYAANV